MTAAHPLVVLAASSSSKSTSGGSSATLLILVAVGAAFYFLFFRPQQRKAKAQREQQRIFEVGDEVLTAGGLVGRVIDVEGERVTLETSVGASFVVLKQYVVRRLVEPSAEDSGTDGEPAALTDGGEQADVEEDPGTDPATAAEGDHLDDEPAGRQEGAPSPNGAGRLGEPDGSEADGVPADETLDAAGPSPEASGRAPSRRSGRRKRRAPGGAPGAGGGPDAPAAG